MGGAWPSLRRDRQAGPTGRLRVTSGPQEDLYPALAHRPRSAAIGGAALLAFSGIFFRFSGVSPSTASVFRCAYALPLLFVLARYEDRHAGGRDRRSRAFALAAGSSSRAISCSGCTLSIKSVPGLGPYSPTCRSSSSRSPAGCSSASGRQGGR